MMSDNSVGTNPNKQNKESTTKVRNGSSQVKRLKRANRERYLKMITKERSRINKFDRQNKIMNIFFVITLPMLIAIALYTSTEVDKRYVNKSQITKEILIALENEADLRAVKNIYENRKTSTRSFKQIFGNMDSYYIEDTPLSKILEDTRTSFFAGGADKKSMLQTVNRIIDEHLERNPFDALEENQKDFFENIRLKSGENYSAIQNEIDKLATELETKNALVSQYLNRSNTSFWISIIALGFSVAVGAIQIFQNRASRMRLFIASALSELSGAQEPEKKSM